MKYHMENTKLVWSGPVWNAGGNTTDQIAAGGRTKRKEEQVALARSHQEPQEEKAAVSSCASLCGGVQGYILGQW